jgi:hypothetical protein
MNAADLVPYHEEQRFRQPLLWALMGTSALALIGLFGYGMIQQLVLGKPWGDRPMPDGVLLAVGTAVIGMEAALLWLFASARLVTQVHERELLLRFRPFHRQPVRLPLEEIVEWEAVTYRPLAEYGGWGIRYGPKGKAYNVSGDRGVRLRLARGESLLIGSQRAGELAAAIGAARRSA